MVGTFHGMFTVISQTFDGTISTSMVKWSLRASSLAMHCIAGGIWKGDILVADVEERKNLDASESTLEDSTQRRFSCQRKDMNLPPHAQMEQSNCQEEVKKSEYPPQFGTYLIKEKDHAMIFKEKRMGLIRPKKNYRKTMRPETIFGVFLEIILIVITFSKGSNFMC